MLLSAGKLLSEHTYVYCNHCSKEDDPSDIKRHYIYEKKRYCDSCNTVSWNHGLFLARGNEKNLIKEPVNLF